MGLKNANQGLPYFTCSTRQESLNQPTINGFVTQDLRCIEIVLAQEKTANGSERLKRERPKKFNCIPIINLISNFIG